jgi:hypothetical protein
MQDTVERSSTVWASLGAIAMLATAQLSAQTAPAGTVAIDAAPGSSLTIRGSTTIGARWHCASTEIASTVTLSVEPSGDGEAPLTTVRGVTIRMPVSGLRCQSGPMERAMLHAMRADQDSASTVIVGRFAAHLSSVVHATEPSGAHLDGTLTVAGVERPVVLVASIQPQPDGSILVRSSVPLTLSTFAISPPSLLFGAVRARDEITIEVDLRFPKPDQSR